jgi:endonuclease
MTCREAIHQVFANDPGVLTTTDAIKRVYSLHPEQPWQRNTISAHLIGLSANHSSSHHYPSFRKHAFLFSLGNGRYRLLNPDTDGTWVVTADGVQLADDGDDALIAEEIAAINESDVGVQLSLEWDLENALVTNLEQLERGLHLYDRDGVRGQQVDTDAVGRLDLLAIDKDGGLVVIELKADRADDRVVGQILRYMGWASEKLAQGASVRGIIVASEFSERARYAAIAATSVKLLEYQVHFSFSTP